MFWNTNDKEDDYKEEIDRINILNQLDKEIKELKDDVAKYKPFEAQLKVADKKISDLEAALKVSAEKEESAKHVATAKYAEHVLKVEDERKEQMQKMYEAFTKSMVEVVKGSTTPLPVIMAPTSSTSKE